MTKRRIPQCEKEEQVVLFGAEDVTSVGSTIDDVLCQIGELDAVSACHADTQCMNRIRPRHSGFPHDLRNGAFRSCRNCDPRRPPSSHFDHCGGRAGAGQGQGRGRPGAGPGFTGFNARGRPRPQCSVRVRGAEPVNAWAAMYAAVTRAVQAGVSAAASVRHECGRICLSADAPAAGSFVDNT